MKTAHCLYSATNAADCRSIINGLPVTLLARPCKECVTSYFMLYLGFYKISCWHKSGTILSETIIPVIARYYQMSLIQHSKAVPQNNLYGLGIRIYLIPSPSFVSAFFIFPGNPALACRACPRHQGRARWSQCPLLSRGHRWTSGLTFRRRHI